MDLKTSFASKTFSSQIPDIEINSSATRVNVIITFDDKELYNENLIPDVKGNITIGELPDLINVYARQKVVATLVVTLKDQTITTAADGTETITDGTSTSLTTTVIYSTALISDNADTFCAAHFLSRLLGPKRTSLGRLEYLHYDGSEAAKVTAYYSDDTTAAFTATKIAGNAYYSTVDVSPSNFVTAGKTLSMFVVTAGSRSQRYEIDFSCPDAAPILLFTNCFGCQELIYCTGTHRVSPDFKYTSVFIGGKLQNYDIEETRNFKADTGPLTFSMADWLSDLFRSDEIYLVNFVNGIADVGRDITISDQKSEYSNDEDELPRFTFTYRYAQRNQNIIETGREGRIFDNTFDNTFN
jgi:hypothetical protein